MASYGHVDVTDSNGHRLASWPIEAEPYHEQEALQERSRLWRRARQEFGNEVYVFTNWRTTICRNEL